MIDSPTRAVEWVSAVANVFAAIGTVAAVVVALFHDQLRDWFWPAAATLELLDPKGEQTYLNGREFVYLFHLRVRNESRRLHNCSLELYEISRAVGDQAWNTSVIPVPLKLRWAPAELQPLEIDLRPHAEATADLLWFRNFPQLGTPGIHPALVAYPANFPGHLIAAGRIRYHIRLVADELEIPVRTTIEVGWSGDWSHDHASLPTVMTVKRLSPAS